MSTQSLITTPFGFESTASEVVAGIDLRGKRAIVTGGSSGIGVETARVLASAGAEVTLAVRDTEAGVRTAAEITSIRSVDKITIGKGHVGPITQALQKEFFGIVNGTAPDRFKWLTPVPVSMKQPVGV